MVVKLSVFRLAKAVMEQSPGHYRVQWDGFTDGGMGVASGVYLYRLQVGSRTETRRLMLLK